MFFNRQSNTEHRIDCISLDPIPKRYDVVLGSSHHDARTISEYMISGGTMHPLTRNMFTPRDYLDVSRKVSGDVQHGILEKGCDIADIMITKTLGIIRAVNFMMGMQTHGHCESLFLIVLVLNCIDIKANIGDYAKKLRETRFAHTLFASRPDVDPRKIHTVLESRTLRDKCDFLDEIECLLVDFEIDEFKKYMKPTDMFELIDVLCDYNVETQYM